LQNNFIKKCGRLMRSHFFDGKNIGLSRGVVGCVRNIGQYVGQIIAEMVDLFACARNIPLFLSQSVSSWKTNV